MKLDRKSAFVVQPPQFLGGETCTRLCKQARKCYFVQRRYREQPVMLSGESYGGGQTLGTEFQDNSQVLEDSGFIVDVDEEDLDEEGLNVVDVLGTKTERPKKVRRKISDLVDEIDVQLDMGYTSDAHTQPPIEDDETAKYIRTVVKAADMRKAEDIVAFRISKLSYIASFVVIATGNNPPQLRAIANLVEEDLWKKDDIKPRRIDGVANSGWILLDYGDFMVNIFSAAQRKNYDLERLWQKAETMDISEYIVAEPKKVEVAKSDTSLDDWLSE